MGFSELTIAALLGHAARGVTQRYIHIDEALRVAVDKVSAEIAALLDRQKSAVKARSIKQHEEIAATTVQSQ
jgi:hypothetical protein